MYKHCTTEESACRQRQIEQCLLELMRTRSYQQITINDICAPLGLSRKSFYRYFSSRDGCLHALIDHAIFNNMAAQPSFNFDPQYRQAIFEHCFTCWKDLRPLLDVLVQNQLVPCLFERALICLVREKQTLRQILHSTENDDGYEQLFFIISGIIGLLINWHNSGYRKTPEQMAATVCRILSDQIFTIM